MDGEYIHEEIYIQYYITQNQSDGHPLVYYDGVRKISREFNIQKRKSDYRSPRNRKITKYKKRHRHVVRNEYPNGMPHRKYQHPDKSDLFRMIGPVITDGQARYIYKKKERQNDSKYKYTYPCGRHMNKLRYILPTEICYPRCPDDKVQKCVTKRDEQCSRNDLQYKLKCYYSADIKSKKFKTVFNVLHNLHNFSNSLSYNQKDASPKEKNL